MEATLLTATFERTIYPIFRRVEFRGKRRLRRVLPVPSKGERIVGFRGGFRLVLDLSEPIQRDYLTGVYDHHELRIVRRLLREGGDFVDVGSHIGIYSVVAALALKDRGRVLAIEPHPVSQRQLVKNLALNGCANATVITGPVSAAAGRARLAVPTDGDASWTTLEEGWLAEAKSVDVETTTVDCEVARLGLEPGVVKIDVEGHELSVLAGMRETIARHRPAVVCEVGPRSAEAVADLLLKAGYGGFRVELARLRPLGPSPGLFNALFLPERPRDREHRPGVTQS